MQVLCQEKATVVICRNSHDEGILDLQLMVSNKIQCGLEGRPRGIRDLKRICPSKNQFPSRWSGKSFLGSDYSEKLTKGLRRQEDFPCRESFYQ